LSHNAFLIASFNLAIGENLKKMESDSDYEEPSEDPFEGQKILEPLKYVEGVVRVVVKPILEYFAPSVLTHKL